MTVKEYRESTPFNEQKAFAEKLQVWLTMYTDEVYKKVMGKMEEIINDEVAIKLIDELYQRSMKEKEDERRTIMYSLGQDDDIAKFGIHNHCLTHSDSYRDVLYDMYIKD